MRQATIQQPEARRPSAASSSTSALAPSEPPNEPPPRPPPQTAQEIDAEWEDEVIRAELAEADREAANPDRTKLHYLPEDLPVYTCMKCLIPLALQDELISKAFSGRNGRAYLMHSTINTKIGKKEDRRLLTGMHTVADLSCVKCSTSLGWVYLKAVDRDQEYKEGKYILEAGKVIKENKWSI